MEIIREYVRSVCLIELWSEPGNASLEMTRMFLSSSR
jgi:hypothetical protein